MPEMEQSVNTTPAMEQSANIMPEPVKRFAMGKTLLIWALLAPGAALAASLMSVVLMGLLRLLAGIPTPPELFADFYLKHINVHVFIGLLNEFAPNSKTTPLGLALLAMIAIGTALGWLYAVLAWVRLPARGTKPGRREWLVAGCFTVVMTLIGVLLFWDELRQNLLGFPIDWARFITALGLLLDFSLYGATLCLAYRVLLPRLSRPAVAPTIEARRQLLSRAGVATLSVGAALGTLGVVRGYLDRYAAYDGLQTPLHNDTTAPITPNDEHYVVTQNTLDPAPDSALWRLEVMGLVHTSGIYTYTELQQLPSTSRAITMECISNGVGGHLMSTAIWQGVTLAALLERHGGVLANARYIAFHSVDGYTTSLPLNEVLMADPLLAWRMNGAELPQRHGFPLRVLIPGRYGEECPKWLTRIELTDHFVSGLYADQGWYNGPLHTTSRIDALSGTIVHGQAVTLSGIAFAGNRGIQKAEVSTDGGTTWQQAQLKPALSPDAWVLWTWQWTPPQPGKYTLAVRATDGTSAIQTGQVQRTVPNGATGYYQMTVSVV